MKFMKKEKINKFRINLGAIGREDNDDKVYIEVEYGDRKDNRVEVGYLIGIYGYGMAMHMLGYNVDLKADEDIEDALFEDVRRLYKNGYIDVSVRLFYEDLDYLEER